MEEFIFLSEKLLSTVFPNSPYNWINYPFSKEAIPHRLIKIQGKFLERKYSGNKTYRR